MRINLLVIGLLFMAQSFANIQYDVSFQDRNEHYIDIEITMDIADGTDETEFVMPVWTPGSYKVREFSQNVDFVSASNQSNQNLAVEKTAKHTWTVKHQDATKITFKYKVYAFTSSVRQTYVDQFYGFMHGVSAFVYVAGREQEEINLNFQLPSNWKQVEVALPGNSKDGFKIANYDLLADSPIALGNFEVGTYQSGGKDHRIVMMGEGSYDLDKVIADFKKISDAELDIFKENPAEPFYIHFIQNVASGGGGLEHLNSQTSRIPRFNYSSAGAYRNFLGLIAHEYFHLWNVKRIRPEALGPFDYHKENYTTLLWQAEGFTAYFDDHILYRAGIHDQKSYFSAIKGNLDRFENLEGRKVMSLEEASYNAWIKAYHPHENSNNTNVSYYNKGMLVALMLDIEIIKATKGKKTLDDVMRSLYNDFYKNGNKGFTNSDLKNIIEKLTKKSFDAFYADYIEGVKTIHWNEVFETVGVEVEEVMDKKPFVGVKANDHNGIVTISFVQNNSPASKAGLSVNDEIIAIGKWRINDDKDIHKHVSADKEQTWTVARDGIIITIHVTPSEPIHKSFELKVMDSPTKTQHKYFNAWLRQADE